MRLSADDDGDDVCIESFYDLSPRTVGRRHVWVSRMWQNDRMAWEWLFWRLHWEATVPRGTILLALRSRRWYLWFNSILIATSESGPLWLLRRIHIKNMLHVIQVGRSILAFVSALANGESCVAWNGNPKNAKLIAYYVLFSRSINHKKFPFAIVFEAETRTCERFTIPQSHSLINNRYYIFFSFLCSPFPPLACRAASCVRN